MTDGGRVLTAAADGTATLWAVAGDCTVSSVATANVPGSYAAFAFAEGRAALVASNATVSWVDASNDTLAPAGTVAFASVDDVVAAAAGYRPLWNDTESGEDLLVPAAARNVSVLQERTMPAAQR